MSIYYACNMNIKNTRNEAQGAGVAKLITQINVKNMRKVKFLSASVLFCAALSIPLFSKAGCTTITWEDDAIQTFCDDGTVTTHSTLQENGGCAGAAEDCHNIQF